FFFSSRRRHTRWPRDWSSDVCSSDLYYTWSPADYGYVVTDPPPVAGSNASDSSSGYGDGGSGADVYLYPRNGQSDAQTQQDRYRSEERRVGKEWGARRWGDQ